MESGKIIYDGRVGGYGKFISNYGRVVGYIDSADNVNIYSYNLMGVAGVAGVAGVGDDTPFSSPKLTRIPYFKAKYLSCAECWPSI